MSATSKKVATLTAAPAIPKNSALYAYDTNSKSFLRTQGKWDQGYFAPYQWLLKDLAKVDKKLAQTAADLIKNKMMAAFQRIVPAQ
jgi:hypothetical protein